ncbi:NAD(P)-dependent nickel-iron dehydrogenase flavin-containing subunit [Rhodobacter aestuarii]|uniref:NAD(P)-dependent nickel-iron dehydrogenase flavin-containing subunit n=1 Tax=Rhodobacter aestuarii TaxID=453582 RepID=A0A1N7L0B7_9RHOB|nr:NAD(P)H-dependent oxidoreductase subunit E [Rhodobacter aestuarii]PTV95476.1 NAD(P)-dependent nickel-iron dehydrogenase flavin-containing subunit [Rhodobacter aestuarii]SIS67100.1 NAD(P)-dependent nickel-iron dehydrogenase flavin-containing subunit [Rhodobacter aestuarii]
MQGLDDTLGQILTAHRKDPRRLVQILRAAQSEAGWISPEIAAFLADELCMPISRIHAVVQFYAFLYDRPVGRYRVLFSDNIIDRMLGSVALRQHMQRRMKVGRGAVSADGLVSIDTTSCTGMGDQGPALMINNRQIVRLTTRRIDEICDLMRDGAPLEDWPSHYFTISDRIRRAESLLGTSYVPGKALAQAIELGPQGVLDDLRRSNLRGRGGAGFTTAMKWELCAEAEAETRYIICNADEGEPGTFKDRVLLNSFAERIFEGMAIGGYAIGARHGVIYLRGEYDYLRAPLEMKLAAMRQRGLLGTNVLGVPGFDFDIEIQMGAGAYICGEETALIESLEGKPGRPRIRPPFPVTRGYNDMPSVVNNVETLCKVVEVMRIGGRAYALLGTKQSTGSKLISVSGDVARPGVYEYPFGVRIQTVLDDCGATDVAAVQISGAGGMTLAPHEFGRRIAFEDVPTSGAFMVFNRSRDMFEVARNFMHFFAHESCGFCTPCRVGCALSASIMDKIAAGLGAQYELNELTRLGAVMRTSSHCGLGQTAGNAVADTLQKFRPDYERRLMAGDFAPAFDLDAALERARQVTSREDAQAHLEGVA